MTKLVEEIRDNYQKTLDIIGSSARRSARSPDEVRLVVVIKSQPIEIVEATIEAGARVLGENYPEEGVTKIQSLPNQTGVEWHMIGHVQSRKARLVAEHFELLHSLDSLKLANKLDRLAGEFNKSLPVLLEFNLGDEETKSGWNASNAKNWDTFFPEIQSILELPNLRVQGLMTMPPLSEKAEESRPYFINLRLLREKLAAQFQQSQWNELSMGTSSDYSIAIEEGATLVRVGTAIVGPRKYKSEKENQ